jgi:hypothetical protein
MFDLSIVVVSNPNQEKARPVDFAAAELPPAASVIG